MTGFEDCAHQRNLTDGGRADARAIGAAIRSLGIPIGEVLASPFCRTRETAELIFGRATVSPAVRGGPAYAEAGRYDELKAAARATRARQRQPRDREPRQSVRRRRGRARISRKAKPR